MDSGYLSAKRRQLEVTLPLEQVHFAQPLSYNKGQQQYNFLPLIHPHKVLSAFLRSVTCTTVMNADRDAASATSRMCILTMYQWCMKHFVLTCNEDSHRVWMSLVVVSSYQASQDPQVAWAHLFVQARAHKNRRVE